MSTPVLGGEVQVQVHEHADRAVRAQQRASQLEPDIAARKQAGVQLGPERHHRRERVPLNPVLNPFHDLATTRRADLSSHDQAPASRTHREQRKPSTNSGPFDGGPKRQAQLRAALHTVVLAPLALFMRTDSRCSRLRAAP